MAEMPKRTETTFVRHEWLIGNPNEPESIARTLRDGLMFAERDIQQLGIDLDFDDAYQWRAGDGGSIVLFVEVEVETP